MWSAWPNSYLSTSFETCFWIFLSWERIFLSAWVFLFVFKFLFCKTNLAAFQILLQNFLPATMCSSAHFMSCPPIACQTRPNLVASAPYFSIKVMGSTPVPRDFDILLPSFAKIVAWIITSENGGLPKNSSEEKTILATQRLMISRAVERT